MLSTTQKQDDLARRAMASYMERDRFFAAVELYLFNVAHWKEGPGCLPRHKQMWAAGDALWVHVREEHAKVDQRLIRALGKCECVQALCDKGYSTEGSQLREMIDEQDAEPPT